MALWLFRWPQFCLSFLSALYNLTWNKFFYNITLISAFKSRLKSRECCTFFDFTEFLQHKIKSRCKNNSTFRIFTTWHSWNGLRRLWKRCDVVKIMASLIFLQHRHDARIAFWRGAWFGPGTTVKVRGPLLDFPVFLNIMEKFKKLRHIEIPCGIWYTLFISNDRNGAVNWRTIRRNNGLRKKKFWWRSVMTVLRNTDSTEQA